MLVMISPRFILLVFDEYSNMCQFFMFALNTGLYWAFCDYEILQHVTGHEFMDVDDIVSGRTNTIIGIATA